MSGDENNSKNTKRNPDDFNQSLEDILNEDVPEDVVDQAKYEDDYVYGDTDDVDYDRLGFSDDEEDADGYSNPKQPANAKGKYEYLMVGDEDEGTEEEPEKLTLQEKVSEKVNKTLDFIESKRFNTMQWVIALGVLIGLGVLLVVLFQASTNLESNVNYQEEAGAKYVAQEIAPEEYSKQESQEAELEKQKEELDTYIERMSDEYARQTYEMGEVPEGHVVVQDEDGTVRYIPQEEYDKLLTPEVRENTTATEEFDPSSGIENMEIEIVPSSEDVWHEITFEPIENVNLDDIYQSRGQFIYFMQKAVPIQYSHQILDVDFDTDTYTMSVVLNESATYPLPEDFEDRMRLAYENSGFQTQAPGQFSIEYSEGNVQDYMGEE